MLPNLVFNHPIRIFPPSLAILSCLALGPASSLPSISLLLAGLLAYFPILLRENQAHRAAWLIVGLSTGRCLAWSRAALTALSDSGTSLVLTFSISLLTSVFALLPIWAFTLARVRLQQNIFLQIVVFQALWVTAWWFVSRLSPVGYLLLWSPTTTTASYKWLLPLFGPSSLDWIAAAWAVILLRFLEPSLMGSRPDDDDDDDGDSDQYLLADHTLVAGFLLLLLTLPSFFTLDLPVASSPLSSNTLLKVGCISPTKYRYQHTLTLDDYIHETAQYSALANILLWPEGAVAFHDQVERNASLTKIQSALKNFKGLLGVSFIETIRDPVKESNIKRNGLALLSRDDVKFVYYKQNLVPVAESFAMQRSREPPKNFTFKLPMPNKTSHNIPLTAAICLDFAMPSLSSSVNWKPALILAPGRTWERSVAFAMWQQVIQRAYELDSTILWCDGEAGVSGIAGQRFDQVEQVGEGSWFREIAIPYPFDEQPTLYARSHSMSGIGAALAFCALCFSALQYWPARKNVVRTANLLGS